MKKTEIIKQLMDNTAFDSDKHREETFDRLDSYSEATLKKLLKVQTDLIERSKK